MTITNVGTKISRLADITNSLAPIPPGAAADVTGVAIDLLDYEGDIVFLVSATALGASKTITVTVEESDASGSGFAAISTAGGGALSVTSAANTALYTTLQRDCDNLKRYVRVVTAITAGSSGHAAVYGFGTKKYGA